MAASDSALREDAPPLLGGSLSRDLHYQGCGTAVAGSAVSFGHVESPGLCRDNDTELLSYDSAWT
jgi:hypothetical protein